MDKQQKTHLVRDVVPVIVEGVDVLDVGEGENNKVVTGPRGIQQNHGDANQGHLTHRRPLHKEVVLMVTWNNVRVFLTVLFRSGERYLGLQVDVSQRHLGHLVEADGQRDGAEDEEAVIYGDPHQDDGLDISRSHFDQQGTNQVDH